MVFYDPRQVAIRRPPLTKALYFNGVSNYNGAIYGATQVALFNPLGGW